MTSAQHPRRAVLASRLFPPEPGAAAFRLGALVRALADRGVEVEVLTTRPPTTIPGRWRHPDTRVRRWPVLRDKGGNVRGYVQYASFDVPLAFRLLFTRRPDVVVVEPPPTTGVVARVVCAVRRIPYVYYAGDVSTTAAAGLGAPSLVVAVLRQIETWVLKGAQHVITVSDGTAQDIRAMAGAKAPVTVVGTGVDTDTFRPLDPGPRTQALVYAGTQSELQGAEVFVRAFAQACVDHPDSELVMYGQGTETDRLRELSETLAPGRVRFPGLVPGAEVARALTRAAAGLASVRPNMGYDYSFPTKMFAVTACGTRVIYAGPGPGRSLVDDHNLGWSVDWTPEAVVEAMRAALGTEIETAEAARLTTWTRANASQDSVAKRAADVVSSVASTG